MCPGVLRTGPAEENFPGTQPAGRAARCGEHGATCGHPDRPQKTKGSAAKFFIGGRIAHTETTALFANPPHCKFIFFSLQRLLHSQFSSCCGKFASKLKVLACLSGFKTADPRCSQLAENPGTAAGAAHFSVDNVDPTPGNEQGDFWEEFDACDVVVDALKLPLLWEAGTQLSPSRCRSPVWNPGEPGSC